MIERRANRTWKGELLEHIARFRLPRLSRATDVLFSPVYAIIIGRVLRKMLQKDAKPDEDF